MQYEFDEAKNQINIEKHGINFDLIEYFNWSSAIYLEDTRFNYGEQRFKAIGYIEFRLYVVIFVDRNNKRRIISLRKANKREEKAYANIKS